ncbi:MAG: EAL domain-containing protein [Myxococcales bacterium]|nr:EAL domain-containing protein [Myxococcales bacterium]
MLTSDELFVVYQPVVDLRTRRAFAYEALARTTAPEFDGPISLFAAATKHGVTGQLGRKLRKLAVDGCPDTPLFLNLNPAEPTRAGWSSPTTRSSSTARTSTWRSPRTCRCRTSRSARTCSTRCAAAACTSSSTISAPATPTSSTSPTSTRGWSSSTACWWPA